MVRIASIAQATLAGRCHWIVAALAVAILLCQSCSQSAHHASKAPRSEQYEKVRAMMLQDLANYETTDSLAYARSPQFQIPRDSLAATSTLDLIADFSSSPVRANMFILSVINLELRAHQLARFSASFQEFLRREDRVRNLLDYYEALQITNDEYVHSLTGRATSSVFTITVLEHVIGYAPVLRDASEAELRRTIRVVLTKSDELAQHEAETGERVASDTCPSTKAVGRCLQYLSNPDFLRSGITIPDLNGCMGLDRTLEIGRRLVE